MNDVEKQNLKVLSHGTELASKVIEKIAGNEISNTVNGEQFTGKEIQRAVAAKLQSAILNNKG
mgnify:CR=1 FL=1